MIVSDLIEALQRMPATATVYIGDEYAAIDGLTYDKGWVIIRMDFNDFDGDDDDK